MGNCVRVKLLFFAKSRELAGLSECEIELPTKIPYAELIENISKTFNLQTLQKCFLIALNCDYIESSTDLINLRTGDELAIIPPISGG